MPSLHDINVTITARANQFDAALRQTQQSTQQLAAQVHRLNSQFAQTRTASSQAGAGFTSLRSQLVGLAAGYASVQAAGQAASAVFAAGQALERQDRAWKAIAGSVEAGKKELDFVRDTANKVGVSFDALEKGYRNLTAASKGTTLEGQATRDIFLAITEAGAQLGLSNQAVEDSLRAITQMISTGTVQSDELKNQLGNHLPGALKIAEKAMGLTTAEFIKQLEQGKILTDDFIPKFARAIRERFVPGMNETTTVTRTSGQELARLGNELTKLLGIVAQDSGMLTWVKNVAGGLADALGKLTKMREEVEKVNEATQLRARAEIVDKRGALPFAPGDLQKAADELAEFDRQIAATQARIERFRKAVAEDPFKDTPVWLKPPEAFFTPTQRVIDREEAQLKQLQEQREKLAAASRFRPPPPPVLDQSEFGFTPRVGAGATTEKQLADLKKLDKLRLETEKILAEVPKVRPDLNQPDTPLNVIEQQLKMVTQAIEEALDKYSELITFMGHNAEGLAQIAVQPPGGVPPTPAIRAQMQESVQPFMDLLRKRNELQTKLGEDIAVGTIGDMRADVFKDQERELERRRDQADKIVEQLQTGVTDADVQRWQQLWEAITSQEAAGDTRAMTETLRQMDEQLNRNNVSLNDHERALALVKLESLGAAEMTDASGRSLLDVAKALAQSNEALEQYKKTSEAWKLHTEGMIDVDRILAQTEEQRVDRIMDIVLQMQEGVTTLREWKRLQDELNGLGAGPGAQAVAKGTRERSLITDISDRAAGRLGDALVDSITRGTEAWKDFGRAATSEFAQILLEASGFQEQMAALLKELGTWLVNALKGQNTQGSGSVLSGWLQALGGVIGLGSGTSGASSLALNPSTDIGGSLQLAGGGPIASQQRAQVGEIGPELLVTRRGARLVGLYGPEVIRPTEEGFILPANVTKSLRQRQQHNPGMMIPQLASRAMGGPVSPGMSYLVGDGGSGGRMATSGPGARGSLREAEINVTMNIHGVQDVKQFARSQSEIKRAAALLLREAQRNI